MSSTPVLVVGAGAWGTALAIVLARNGCETFLWGRDAKKIAAMSLSRSNEPYLNGVKLPDGLSPIAAISDIPSTVDCVVIAVPFQALRNIVESLAANLPKLGGIACASKGIERDSGLFAHEIVAETFGAAFPMAMLSGPNFAGEVAKGLPAAITVGANDTDFGETLVGLLYGASFRPYLNRDVIGVEVGGAVKNVLAIAAGVADGLELGANSRAALITRGLAEITRLGMHLGGQMGTFMGLSGLGDLVLTCTDDKSRNRQFGKALATGMTVIEATDSVGLVEGIPTAEAVVALAERHRIEMPIATQVARMLRGQCQPEEAVLALLSRDPTDEVP